MRARHWILLMVLGMILLVALPRPLYRIGFFMMAATALAWVADKSFYVSSQRHHTERLIYKALEDNDAIRSRDLASQYTLSPRDVRRVLRQWQKQGWVKLETADGAVTDAYHLTMTGQAELQKRYGRSNL